MVGVLKINIYSQAQRHIVLILKETLILSTFSCLTSSFCTFSGLTKTVPGHDDKDPRKKVGSYREVSTLLPGEAPESETSPPKFLFFVEGQLSLTNFCKSRI